jgi:hypothetical protein
MKERQVIQARRLAKVAADDHAVELWQVSITDLPGRSDDVR